MTELVAQSARADGAREAYLQASGEAEQLYQGMGFRAVDEWSVWVTD